MANKTQESRTQTAAATETDADKTANAAAEAAAKEQAEAEAAKAAPKPSAGTFAVTAPIHTGAKIYQPGDSIDLSTFSEAKIAEMKAGGFIADPT